MIIDGHGPGYVGYFQAIARRQDDGNWLLERKAESQAYSVATGKDLKPPEVVDFDTMLRKMDAFANMYQDFNMVTAPPNGTHVDTVKALIKSNAAGRMKAIQKMRRNRGLSMG